MPDLKALAAKARGLAPQEIMQQVRPGAVFAANDEAIGLPEERLDGGIRGKHVTRRVIIIQAPTLIRLSKPCTISVIPCSASQGAAGHWDLLLPSDEPGFDAPKVVAYVSLLQPILKSDLVKCYGFIRETTLLTIQSLIAENLGLIPSSRVKLPPRDKVAKADDVSTPIEHAVVQFRSVPEPE